MTRKFYVHVSLERGDKKKIYGPFDDHNTAFAFATPYAGEGLDVEIHTDIPVCDFCSTPEVSWGYEARDFHVKEPDVRWGSRGGWAACGPCHDFIEANDRKGLTERSVDLFYSTNPELEHIPRDFVRQQVMLMHAVFFEVKMSGAQEGGLKE